MAIAQATIDSPLLKKTRGYMGGQWAEADSRETFHVINPATGDRLAEVPKMEAEETQRACEFARQALADAPSIAQRKQWLEQIAALHDANKRELGRIVTLENGKPIKEGVAEVEYAAGFYRNCARHIDKLQSHTLDERPKDCEWTVHYRPAGVVGLITPWNFPIAMIAKKRSAAVAAGGPAVIKPSSQTPLTLIALMRVLDDEMDLPRGMVNLVTGPASAIGDVLCEHPAVRVISFTGSTEVGKKLMEKCAPHMKRLTLELGGNAPFIVFDDADLDAAADNLIKNKFRASGQTCVCANRIYAHSKIAGDFAKKVAKRMEELNLGNGINEETDVGPLINRDGFDKVKRHMEDALDNGAERVAGEDPAEPKGDDWGCYFPPTVLRGVTESMKCAREETFGPLVPILEFDDEDDAIRRANGTEFGLAAYFFTGDEDRAHRVAAALQFGHVGWNTGDGPTPEAPFGGMKHSGYGREGGETGVFEFVEIQTVPRGN